MVIFLLQFIGSDNNVLMINGFWEVSEQFKSDANIDQMMFYFDEGKGYDYKGYLITVVDGETIYNDSIEFRITPKSYFRSDCYEFVMSRGTGIMPKKMTMELNTLDGSMVLKCLRDNKVYASLLKDNQMSAKTIIVKDLNSEEYVKSLKEEDDNSNVIHDSYDEPGVDSEPSIDIL